MLLSHQHSSAKARVDAHMKLPDTNTCLDPCDELGEMVMGGKVLLGVFKCDSINSFNSRFL